MMDEREAFEKEIEKLKMDLKSYLEIYPILGVSAEEKERVTNMFLDDILLRQEKLKKMK